MNPDAYQKTRSVWPTLQIKIARWKKWAWIGFSSQLSVTAHALLVPLLSLTAVWYIYWRWELLIVHGECGQMKLACLTNLLTMMTAAVFQNKTRGSLQVRKCTRLEKKLPRPGVWRSSQGNWTCWKSLINWRLTCHCRGNKQRRTVDMVTIIIIIIIIDTFQAMSALLNLSILSSAAGP